jgi:hypothetical protein
MEPQGLLPCLQEPSLVPILSQMNSTHTFIHTSQQSDWLWPGQPCFDSHLGTFFYVTVSRPALGPATSYVVRIGAPFNEDKAAGTRSWPLTSLQCYLCVLTAWCLSSRDNGVCISGNVGQDGMSSEGIVGTRVFLQCLK